jgi:hypothetical protein
MDTSFSSDEHFRRGRAALDCNNHAVALEHFCAAQRVDPNSPRIRSYYGFKAEGIRYLRRGLMIDPANQQILDDLKDLGVRRRPPFAFLPRRHLINRWIGMLRGRPQTDSQERCEA